MRISDWSSDVCSSDVLPFFMRVKRAGFKPSLNLLYALEGALQDCHWQEVPDERRVELVEQAEAAIAGLPPPRNRPPAGPVTTTVMPRRDDAAPTKLFDDTDD